ncbi:hypothetical protein ACFQ6U_00870 [Streptomyces sp. NPDC056465]|uniref:hypothetical protein n=1 Tax=Streptomyces sp. NPDC056465 TaxID=3345829 RepID=UPI00368492D0
MTPDQESAIATHQPIEVTLEHILRELTRRVDTHDPLGQAQLTSLRAVLYLLRHEQSASTADERVELLTRARDCARSSATVLAYALGEAMAELDTERHETGPAGPVRPSGAPAPGEPGPRPGPDGRERTGQDVTAF